MIPFERLAAWVLEELDDPEADRVEEHVMACDECAATATRLLELRQEVARAAKAGAARHVATPSLLARYEDEDLDVRRYEVAPGGAVSCQATATQIYAISRLEAELEGILRLDLEVGTEDGTVLDRVTDLPFSPHHGGIALVEPGDAIRMLPTMTLRLELHGIDDDGRSRRIGVYRLHHQALN